MDIYKEIRDLILDALGVLSVEGIIPPNLGYENIVVEPPRDRSHGDMATNAAMVLSKEVGRPPREIAKHLSAALILNKQISDVQVAGPGFINIRLENRMLTDVVRSTLVLGKTFGSQKSTIKKSINIEYISANPTGPLHVGHTRGAVFGDSLSRLLQYVGHDVTKEYYINDGGAQVDVLARSVYLRYLEAFGMEISFEEGTYPGDYLIDVGKALKTEVGDKYLDKEENVWIDYIRDFAVDRMMGLIKADLVGLGIEIDNFFSEKSLYKENKIDETLNLLSKKDLIYDGVLDAPKGKKLEEWEPRKQTLFKSTAHGDDIDRPIKKSDGSWTYFAPDIAYHHNKISRGYDHLIDVLGADHGGYVKRMKAAVSALSDGKVDLEIKLVQLVKLYKDRKPYKMPKRSGTFVTLSDLVKEGGSDVVRFVLLTRKNDAPLDFDFTQVLEQSKDNPVFYVQYAHARICSVLRKAEASGLNISDKNLALSDLQMNTHEAELNLTRKIGEWPRIIQVAARNTEPHRIAFFLYELAGEFHYLWNKGNDIKHLRFIQDDEKACLSKLALARSVAIIISSGLYILGVEPAKEMR